MKITINNGANVHKSQYRSFCPVFASVALLFCSQDKQSFHFLPLGDVSEPTKSASGHTTSLVTVRELRSFAGLFVALSMQSEEH